MVCGDDFYAYKKMKTSKYFTTISFVLFILFAKGMYIQIHFLQLINFLFGLDPLIAMKV